MLRSRETRNVGLRGFVRATFIVAVGVFAIMPRSTETAIANGDTRTLHFSNAHVNESGAFTYMVNGVYNSAELEKINWIMRDWRLNEPTKMDPKMLDIVWEVYRESGSSQSIDILSGYRSPSTNAMLRARSHQVAEHSQHMQGRALDAHFTDVGVSRIRDIAMRLQAGGVGFYPVGTTWVHIDSGSVRYWPRMNHDSMARIFPDGKTVFIPSDGQPMARYAEAKAEVEARGGSVFAYSGSSGGFLSWLFGHSGGADDAEEGSGIDARGGGRNGVGAVAVASADSLSGRSRRGDTALKAQPAKEAPPPVKELQPVLTPVRVEVPPPPAKPDSDVQVAGADASPILLHGPVAAQFAAAPLPPRRPANLGVDAPIVAAVPLPPVRPSELVATAAPLPPVGRPAVAEPIVIASADASKLPSVITRGLKTAPADSLALAELSRAPMPPERPTELAKAAALDAPLPPARPRKVEAPPKPEHFDETAVALASPITRAQKPTALLAMAQETRRAGTHPFGDLPWGMLGTKTNPRPMDTSDLSEIRGSTD